VTPYLFLVLLPLIGLVVRDALMDRTPRRPYVWSRPGLAWWATKRTARERARTAITIGAERQA
jgi:hypothetical protein